MSEVLARIRVKEEHGIRRFLYPLSLVTRLKGDIDATALGLVDHNGDAVPLQIAPILGKHGDTFRLDFAVSLAPHDEILLSLMTGTTPNIVNDPLQTVTHENGLRSIQMQFAVRIGSDACILEVVYDGVSHLSRPSSIMHNRSPLVATSGSQDDSQREDESGPLRANVIAFGIDKNEHQFDVQTELTACKSWTNVSLQLHKPQPNDEITFTLPFAITAPTLTCDFGVGGGTFGKLQTGTAAEVVWKTEFNKKPFARWSLITSGRVDYIGEVATAKEFLPQRWFHLIDSDKALAVAITEVPKSCREMKVSLNILGDVVINFQLGDKVEEAVTFGVCYHFLNDVPAIAAATNPQSILLPPTVEVLPV